MLSHRGALTVGFRFGAAANPISGRLHLESVATLPWNTHTGKEVVMVAGRSGIHRAKKLASTLAHWHAQFRLHLLPAHCGHHLNPIEGFWRVMKDRIGAGRCFPDLHQLYQRTRRVLMAHQDQPIYAFHWQQIPPRI